MMEDVESDIGTFSAPPTTLEPQSRRIGDQDEEDEKMDTRYFRRFQVFIPALTILGSDMSILSDDGSTHDYVDGGAILHGDIMGAGVVLYGFRNTNKLISFSLRQISL